MEGEKKRGRGWWTLVAIGVLTLLGLYVGAYYATVFPMRPVLEFDGQGEDIRLQRLARGEAIAGYHWESALGISPAALFDPIHCIDRKLRPETWGPKPPP
jgi:hypothetical protein